ncbi:MAG: Ig-like domain-containing protein [Chlorobium sp.]
MIVRYNSDGLLDTSFGNAGIVLADIASGDDMIRGITTQRDGKILVTLWSDNFSSPNFVLARYNSNGTLDTSFDGDGLITTDIVVGDNPSNSSVTVQNDGKIVVVGKSNNGSNDDVSVVRYNSDGSLDTTFDPLNTLSSKPTYTEDGTAIVLGCDIKIFDADLAVLGNYGGTTLSLARHGGASADDRFSGDGIVAGSASGTVTVAGSNIGSYTWSNGTLAITFTTQATQTLVNQAMEALAYQNVNTAPPATVQLDWTFSDGNGSGAQGSGGVSSITGYKTVALTAVTQAPTLTAFSGAVTITNEDTRGAITFADLIAKGNEADADGSVTAFVVKALSSGNLKIGTDAVTATPYNPEINNVIDATHHAYWLPVGDTNGILNAFTVVVRDNEHATSATAVQVTVNTVAVNDAPTFYVGSGLVTTDVTAGNDYGHSVVVQTDGKILMAGNCNNDFGVVRYNTDGTLDTTFDYDGKVATGFNLSNDDARDMVVQSDGKIVVVGATGSDVALMRYKSNGALDTTFDGDGKVNTSVNSGVEVGHRVALQSNGKIVVAGYSTNSSGYVDALLIRYNKDGSLDSTFDGDGIVTTALSIQNDAFGGVVLQADGKILAAGYSFNSSNNDVALVRYNSDGSLDTSFGAGGIVTTAIGSDDVGQVVTVQADGKILVAGYCDNNFALLRYNADGMLDPSFGSSGKVATDISYNDHGNSVIVQPDGKILVAGNSWNWAGKREIGRDWYNAPIYATGSWDYGFTLVRYNSNGSLDTTFDNDGKIYDDLWYQESDGATSVTLQNDGKILVGGYAENDHFFALIRYNTNGSRDTTFNQTTNTLNGALAYTENGAPAVLDSDVQIVDSEANVKGNYGDATLTLERHGGSSAEDLFSGAGIVAGSASGNVVVSSVNIGSYTWVNGKLLVTFNVQATRTLVNQAMSALAYSNASDTPSSSAQIDWSFSDGDSTGPLIAKGSTPVTITAVNDAPTLTAFAAPVANGAENQSLEITFNTLLAQGNEADADGSVTAFVVNAVSTGTLTLGTSASSATAWNATTNSIIDATHQAYWTPASTANGDLNAFTVVARDNNGAASATSVQTLVHIVPSQNTVTLTSSSPADNAANVTARSNIVLTFSDVVQAGTGNIIITDGTDERIIAITDTTQVTLDGKTVTINPMADLQAGHHYHVTMASGALLDMAGNPFPGISDATTLDFTTNAPPTLTTFKAVVESTTQNTAIEISYADLAAQGDEADSDGTVAAFIVTSLSAGILKIGSDATTATTWDAVTNNTLDATHQAYWKPANNAGGDLNAFTVVAKDNNGLESPLPVQTQVHVTAGPVDLNPPVLLTATPADNTTGVAVASNIVLTFNEIVQAGTGNLIITDGTDERIIAMTDTTQVTFNRNMVTINPTADLHAGSNYHVTIASDAIKDVTGNAYTGIIDATTLDFTTIISPTHDLTENITFWKTGAAISDVATTITTAPTGSIHPIALKNIHLAADGSHVVEVWATTPNSTTGSMELEFALPTGSSATWQTAVNLPVGWTSAVNTIASSGHLLVGGMSANPLAEGQVKLGTLTITAPTNPGNLELLLVGGQLGDNDLEGFGISSISSNTGSGNEYLYHSLNDGNYILTVDKLAGAREAGAVHANDALAALKMAVEINPNSDGSSLLPYQFLAADFNRDGIVRANDAFNLLKMSVGIDTTPDDKWIFVSEDEALAATMSRTAVDWSVADINVLLNADTQLHLIGIVKGDVDGSWVGVG